MKSSSITRVACVGATMATILAGVSCARVLSVPSDPFEVGRIGQWPIRFDDPSTLGGALEPFFERVLSSCGASLAVDSLPRTAVPAYIRGRLDVNRTVTAIGNTGSARLFTHLFRSPDVREIQLEDIRSRLHPHAIGARPVPAPAEGSRAVAYRQTCNFILNDAITAGLAVPPQSLQAALQRESELREVLTLVRGTFDSPLSAALSVRTAPAERRFALLEIWQWYRDNPHRVRESPLYLSTFDGVALFLASEAGREFRFDATGEAGLSLLFARLDGRIEMSTGASSSATLSDYATLILHLPDTTQASGTAPAVRFASLPSPTEIAAEFTRVRPLRDPERPAVLTRGVGDIADYSVEGLPAPLCAPEEWVIGEAVGEANAALLAVTSPRERQCSFRIEFTPHPDSVEGRDNLDAEFLIASAQAVGEARLVLRVRAAFNTTEGPTPVVVGPAPVADVFNPAVGFPVLRWSVPVQVVGEGRVSGVRAVTLSCDQTDVPASGALADHAGRITTITVRRPLTELESLVDAEHQTCQLTLELTVELLDPAGDRVRVVRFLQQSVQGVRVGASTTGPGPLSLP